jgi:NUMOD4 motif
MEINWAQIEDFPNYTVSNFGDVVNETTGKLLRQSKTQQGAIKVNLIRDGLVYTQSVKVLVAEAFVDGYTEKCNTPIHLDGNQNNVRADNLMWRERGYAWLYARQFIAISDHHRRGPIVDLQTRDRYLDVYEVATLNGLLFKEVWYAINFNEPTKTTNQRFRFIR